MISRDPGRLRRADRPPRSRSIAFCLAPSSASGGSQRKGLAPDNGSRGWPHGDKVLASVEFFWRNDEVTNPPWPTSGWYPPPNIQCKSDQRADPPPSNWPSLFGTAANLLRGSQKAQRLFT